MNHINLIKKSITQIKIIMMRTKIKNKSDTIKKKTNIRSVNWKEKNFNKKKINQKNKD
jgi:hypothetical protein